MLKQIKTNRLGSQTSLKMWIKKIFMKSNNDTFVALYVLLILLVIVLSVPVHRFSFVCLHFRQWKYKLKYLMFLVLNCTMLSMQLSMLMESMERLFTNKYYYLKNHWTKHRLVCIHFDAFAMLILNLISKFSICFVFNISYPDACERSL